MTSSLVGSEMCIRDSPTTAVLTCISVTIPSSWAVARMTSSVVACTVTVSYTHLTLPTICSV
eukprot:10345329-Prorocentrum_lima.AAC.1